MIAAGGTADERLLVLASLVAPTAAERAEIASLAGEITDWSGFLALARVNATIPLVQRRLEHEQLFGMVPADVAKDFLAVSGTIAETNDLRLEGSLELLRRFDDAGIRCVVLKGMLFASEVYQDPHYKRMNDLDILVEIERIEDVIAIYRELEMFCVSELLGKEPAVRESRSHHLPSFVSSDGALVVGTHWGLITPLAPYRIDYAAIWSRVRRIDYYGVPAWAMAHEDNLHHLCIHLPYYKTGVRELADIWNLVRYAGDDLNWRILGDEIGKAGSHNLVFHALSLANRLVPEKHCQKLAKSAEPQADRFYRADVTRKTRHVRALLRSRSTHTSVIEKAYTEFNATSAASEKWVRFTRLWANLLDVPAADAAKMSSLHHPSRRERLKAKLAAPYRLTKVFQRDLGPWLFPAALVKTVYDLGAAYVAQLGRGGRPADNLDMFAAKVGFTRAELQSILDGQE
ncbi:hypothetical protein MSTE_03396 [Mycobacteroides stephanolepidis]|uniref:Uncharacterized protein n=1 Tax=[Mycobacterium] stephanolepidis TaxID=1520670 RepID=A0A1Z4F0H9_9MYCO|nr:nucleotidyltransferase family protein [[Mycobacterium] stephanolepidis]BAX98697.1 hypothetical protein MSTE_03396 [[Mycobacterium] stephanolepidis]